VKHIKVHSAALTLLVFASPFSASAAETADMAILQESKPLVTRTGAWHTWNDQIHLKPGQEKLPLQLVFTNGSDGRPKTTDLQVFLGDKEFAGFKDFVGDNFSRDLTGKLRAGNTALKVRGFGPSGGRMNWKVLVQRPVVNSVNPATLSAADSISVEGSNFSDQPNNLKVYIGKKYASPVSSSAKELKFKLPSHTPGGAQTLVVAHHGIKSEPFKVSVRSNPRVTGINMLASPPQQPVTIFGTGFSPTAGDNVVHFGTVRANVVSASETQLNCLVPNMQFPRWHVPIKVVTNGLPAQGKVYINVDVRVIENEGIPLR